MSNQVSPEDEPLLEQRTQSLSLADIPSDTTQEFVEGISNNPQSAEPPKNATADFVEDEEVGNESRRDSRVSTPMLDVDEDFERKQKRKQRKRKGRKSKSKLKMKTKTKKTGKPKEALVWKNVIVTKKTRQKKYKEIGKTILDDVSGQARAGELTFIMGSSGAGKTSLLNVLSGRNNSGLAVKGEVYLHDRSTTPTDLKETCAYVQQEDLFLATQTVSEVLHFALKMTSHQRNQSRAKRHARVQQLLERFGLKNCEHTPIGSQTITGLSRGEKKRLTIACELLTDPPVMFCDEPTTGLDSFTACEVMKCLKGLARDGKIVVCTIHQPATWVYQMADRLVLLCQGRVAYEGRTRNVPGFLERIGSPLPEFASVSDHFIRVLSRSVGEDVKDYEHRIETILSLQQSSKLPKSPSLRSSRSENSRKTVRRSWLFQFQTLVARGLVQISRRKRYIAARLALTVLVSWFLGMVYLQVPIHKDHLLGIKGVVFAALQMNNILYMMPSLISFWEDYPVVVREYQSNMYSASAYFMARSLTDSILHLIFPIIFFNIIYFMIGLPVTFKAISTFLVMCVAMSMIITSLSHAVVSLCGDVTISMSVAPLISVPVMVFGGFLITVDAVPWYYKPLSYISWYHYAFEAIMTALFEDHGKIEGCSPNFTMFLPTQLNFECSTGLQFIKDQDFDVSNFWWDFGAVGLILAFWNVFGLVAFVCTVRRWS